MINKILGLSLILLLSFNQTKGQSIQVLKQQITDIIRHKDATVGVAINGINPKDSLSINGDVHLPLQSVFKYHLALAVLDQVDQGKISLKDTITITKENLDNTLWSPIRKKYPQGTSLTLTEILEYTVASSDNVGCDILFSLLGGTNVVEKFLHEAGITDIAITYNETIQQSQWDLQYKNWTTAKSANKALKLFFENSQQQLSPQSHTFLWNTMKSTWTGKNCIRGFLPEGTVVAHKTGYSGVNKEGIIGARNNIGVLFLPDGTYFYLSVFVCNSKENKGVNDKIIADIAKASWDYFISK